MTARALAPEPLLATDRAVFTEADHRALDHVLADVEFLVARRSYHSAALRFGELRLAIERHTSDEERGQVPLFLRRGGDPALADELHAQHRRVLDAIAVASRDISAEDHQKLDGDLTLVAQALREHLTHEERVFQPAFDALAAAGVHAVIGPAIAAVRESLRSRREALERSRQQLGRATAQFSEVADIDAALLRIERGQFGQCAECDSAIGWQRLRAMPEDPLCITCAARARR